MNSFLFKKALAYIPTSTLLAKECMIFPLKPLKVTLPVMVMLLILIEVLKVVSLKLASFSMVILPVLLKFAPLKELAPLKLKLPLLKAVLLVALKSLLKMNAPHSISPH